MRGVEGSEIVIEFGRNVVWRPEIPLLHMPEACLRRRHGKSCQGKIAFSVIRKLLSLVARRSSKRASAKSARQRPADAIQALPTYGRSSRYLARYRRCMASTAHSSAFRSEPQKRSVREVSLRLRRLFGFRKVHLPAVAQT